MASKRILILDDDKELCEELAEFLKGEGHKVSHTQDCVNGQTLISETSYDVFILDYKITGSTGFEIIKKVSPKNRKMKVLLMSGRPFIEKLLEEEGLHNRVSAVIRKPVELDTLLRKI